MRYVPPTDKSEAAEDISSIGYSLDSPAPLKVELDIQMQSK